MILVPPELDETDLTLLSGTTGATGEKALPAPSTSAGLRGDEGVGYEGTRLQLRLFEDDSVPSSEDRAGNVLRGLISDVVNLYEVNRKEGAGVLLELPRWVKEGTFRDPKVKKKDEEEMDEDKEKQGPQWSLENLIVEVNFNFIYLASYRTALKVGIGHLDYLQLYSLCTFPSSSSTLLPFPPYRTLSTLASNDRSISR